MALTITPLPAGDEVTTERAHSLVEAVHDVLGFDWSEDVHVHFGVWRGELKGLAYVCKVECLAGDPFAAGGSWRWWSPIVKDADGLRLALGDWIRDRRGLEDRAPHGAREALAAVSA